LNSLNAAMAIRAGIQGKWPCAKNEATYPRDGRAQAQAQGQDHLAVHRPHSKQSRAQAEEDARHQNGFGGPQKPETGESELYEIG